MKIDAYSFGSMTVEGRVYDKDLIVFPDRVKSGWWRKEGHTLLIEDLEEVLNYKPQVLVVGRGAYGVMEIPLSTKEALKRHSIEVIDKDTDEACKIFNRLIQEGKRVVGAFHLTC
jgi:hypothetical protein